MSEDSGGIRRLSHFLNLYFDFKFLAILFEFTSEGEKIRNELAIYDPYRCT